MTAVVAGMKASQSAEPHFALGGGMDGAALQHARVRGHLAEVQLQLGVLQCEGAAVPARLVRADDRQARQAYVGQSTATKWPAQDADPAVRGMDAAAIMAGTIGDDAASTAERGRQHAAMAVEVAVLELGAATVAFRFREADRLVQQQATGWVEPYLATHAVKAAATERVVVADLAAAQADPGIGDAHAAALSVVAKAGDAAALQRQVKEAERHQSGAGGQCPGRRAQVQVGEHEIAESRRARYHRDRRRHHVVRLDSARYRVRRQLAVRGRGAVGVAAKDPDVGIPGHDEVVAEGGAADQADLDIAGIQRRLDGAGQGAAVVAVGLRSDGRGADGAGRERRQEQQAGDQDAGQPGCSLRHDGSPRKLSRACGPCVGKSRPKPEKS
jgi:hypothetical protein